MLLLIDNRDSFTWNLAHHLRAGSAGGVTVLPAESLGVDEVLAGPWTGVVLGPGPGGPHQARLSMRLARRASSDRPVYGVCLGMQVLCAAFGAVLDKGAPVHGSAHRLHTRPHPLFEGLPPSFTVGRYHSLRVREASLPDELRVIARAADGTVMAVAHEALPLFGVQFHPESVLTEHRDRLAVNAVRLLRTGAARNALKANSPRNSLLVGGSSPIVEPAEL